MPNDAYKEACQKDYFSTKKLEIREFENAVSLPNINGVLGGIYDENFCGVENVDSDQTTVPSKIEPIAKLDFIDESVILGGLNHLHFGHILLQTLSRFWYMLENPRDTRKIAFITYDINTTWSKQTITKECFYRLLGLLDIKQSRILIIERPTRFKHLTIPDMSMKTWTFHTAKYPQIYSKIIQNANKIHAKSPKFEKIFISHLKWKHRKEQCFLNEQIYDEFFANLGYKIIYPEEVAVDEMAYLISNAKDIAAPMGTLTHYALFCRPNTRFVMLTRDYDQVLHQQININQAMKIDYFLVNAANNYLPSTDIVFGVVNFDFTEDFKEFVADNFAGDFSEIFAQKADIFAYLKAFVEYFEEPKNFKQIMLTNMNLSAFDFVNKLSEVLFHKSLDKRLFNDDKTSEIANLKAQIELLEKRTFDYFFKHKIYFNLIKKPINSLKKRFKKHEK